MRVLMISGDPNILDPESNAGKRLALQRAQVEELVVYVWPKKGFVKPFFEQGPFNVVTVQDPFWRGLLGLVLSRRFNARLNVQVHTDLRSLSRFRITLAKFVLRRASSARVVSEEIKQQLERLGVRIPVHVLPIYTDISAYRHIAHVAHEGKIILWIGRFEEEKDPKEAVEVFKQVCAAGINAKLVMLGSGSEEDALRRFTKDLPVEFPGWRDPSGYLAQADVVLSTSKHESYGASIIEALAARVVVVAPDVGVAREAGAIVAPRERLAEAVVEVLKKETRGELKLKLLSKEEWASKWKETLL